MEHPSASEFSQIEFPIKNALDGSLMQQEMSCHCSGTCEGKLLRKTLKGRPKEIRGRPGRSLSLQKISPDLNLRSQFLTVDNEITLS
jgi:hypothetical protein